MKGYFLIEENQEWFYLTIETSSLRPMMKPVVNPIYAKYKTSTYTIKKITCYSDKTKNLSEIRTDSRLYKVGETYQVYSYQYFPIVTTMKGLHADYKYATNNSWGRIHYNRNGCFPTYYEDGSILSKSFYKNNVLYKKIRYYPEQIFKTNYKKNETTYYKYNNNKCKFTVPFVAWVSHKNPKQYDKKQIFVRSQVIILSVIYDENGKVKYKTIYANNYSNNKKEGILYDYISENKCGVYWSGRYVSKNLQKWYQTPLNFIFRKNNKIKCF